MVAGRRLHEYLFHTAREVSRESTSRRIDRRNVLVIGWGYTGKELILRIPTKEFWCFQIERLGSQ